MLHLRRVLVTWSAAIIIAVTSMACGNVLPSATTSRAADWRNPSHSDAAAPNYAVIFPQDKVNKLTITITPENWAAMQTDMTKLFGAKGTGGNAFGGRGGDPAGRQPPGDGMQAPPDGVPPDGVPPDGGPAGGRGGDPAGRQPPGDGMQAPPDGVPPEGGPPGGFPGARGPGGPGGFGRNTDMTPVNPSWVEATITFDGQTWTHVGVRYKGNSTLMRAWRSGSAKLPLKLDFDQFETTYPEIANQRFYGFKQLAFGNNLSDASYLRDALSYDIMAAAGLVTPKTAFYEVVVDYGEGPVSLGLYTAVEVVDDTVIERYFANSNGNIYEGDGVAASLAAGTKDQIKTSFQKENNRAAANWSDIQRLYDVLHSDQRTSNAAVWRAKLEAVFDVDAFLEWLAVSTVIQDWDAYGTMSHNYYLYHDPASGRLVWISWDHNEALGVSGRGDTSLNKASIGQNWPLIRFLLDDPIYQAKYTGYLRDCLADAFVPAQLTEKTDAWAALLRPYADKEGKSQAFESAISQLKTLLTQRAAAVEGYLAGQK